MSTTHVDQTTLVDRPATTTLWKSDPDHSSVIFTVRHMVVAEVMGRFRDFEATLTQKNPDFSDSLVEATIRAESIDTNVEARDNHLRSPDFFEVERFQNLTFKSKSFEMVAEDRFRMTGDLTIRDVTKLITLDVRYLGKTIDPEGVLRHAFKATTSLDRYEYGLRWNQALESGGVLVGKTIDITLTMNFIQST